METLIVTIGFALGVIIFQKLEKWVASPEWHSNYLRANRAWRGTNKQLPSFPSSLLSPVIDPDVDRNTFMGALHPPKGTVLYPFLFLGCMGIYLYSYGFYDFHFLLLCSPIPACYIAFLNGQDQLKKDGEAFYRKLKEYLYSNKIREGEAEDIFNYILARYYRFKLQHDEYFNLIIDFNNKINNDVKIVEEELKQLKERDEEFLKTSYLKTEKQIKAAEKMMENMIKKFTDDKSNALMLLIGDDGFWLDNELNVLDLPKRGKGGGPFFQTDQTWVDERIEIIRKFREENDIEMTDLEANQKIDALLDGQSNKLPF